jgi:hypothetical protein
VVVQSSIRVGGWMLVLSFMSVVGSGASDLDGQIWSNLGFFILAFLLLWSKLNIRWRRETPFLPIRS